MERDVATKKRSSQTRHRHRHGHGHRHRHRHRHRHTHKKNAHADSSFQHYYVREGERRVCEGRGREGERERGREKEGEREKGGRERERYGDRASERGREREGGGASPARGFPLRLAREKQCLRCLLGFLAATLEGVCPTARRVRRHRRPSLAHSRSCNLESTQFPAGRAAGGKSTEPRSKVARRGVTCCCPTAAS